jgi:hypothetical protein
MTKRRSMAAAVGGGLRGSQAATRLSGVAWHTWIVTLSGLVRQIRRSWGCARALRQQRLGRAYQAVRPEAVPVAHLVQLPGPAIREAILPPEGVRRVRRAPPPGRAPQGGGPPRRQGGPNGVREPRRPIRPAGSSAAEIPLPMPSDTT